MTVVPNTGFESALATFVADASPSALTEDRRRAATRLLTDQLALQIGLSELPWSRSAIRYGLENGKEGACTIAGSGRRMDIETAAFVNATLGHGFEYDDVHNPSNGHPGCIVVPTGLAVGEATDATLEEVLVAIGVGYEVYGRIGTLGGPHLQNRGWHAHALLGRFGAAAVAAVLWDWDREMVHQALSIASSHASGFLEYSSTGGSVKRAHAGIAARDGIQAARMADSGITGPRRYLTGQKGFFNTFLDGLDRDWDERASDLDHDRLDQLAHLWIKNYCTCGCIHAFLDAMRSIDPDPERVSRITAHIQPQSDAVVGTTNENATDPRDIVEAQYSLPYQLALTLRGFDNGYRLHREFTEGSRPLDDPETRRLARTVDIVVDPELDETYAPKLVGKLEVEWTDGTAERCFVEDPRGTPENPLSEAAFRDKFDDLTVPVVGKARSAKLYELLEDFDSTLPVVDVMSLTH